MVVTLAAMLVLTAVAGSTGAFLVAPGNASQGPIGPSSTPIKYNATTIPVGDQPYAAAFDPRNGDLYVANMNSDNVSVISTSSNTVVGSIPVGYNPERISINNATDTVYVADVGGSGNPGGVTVISGASNTVVATVRVGSNPSDLLADPFNNMVYVANEGTQNVSVISGATNTVVRTLPIYVAVGSLLVDPESGDVYLGESNLAEVAVVSGATNQIVANIGVSSLPDGIVYDPGNGDVYVATGNLLAARPAGVVDGILPSNNSVFARVPVVDAPQTEAFDPVNGDIYVPGYFGNISVMSTSSEMELSVLQGGDFTFQMAVDNSSGDVLVTSMRPPQVAALSGETLLGNISLSGTPMWVTYAGSDRTFYVCQLEPSGAGRVAIIPASVLPSAPASSGVGSALPLGFEALVAVVVVAVVAFVAFVWTRTHGPNRPPS